MLNRLARAFFTTLLTPIAKFLLACGLSADAVSLLGTLGVCVTALWAYPTGHLALGSAVIGLFAFADVVDGLMARLSNTSCRWGSFLDSTLDRVADGAIFGGVVLWATGMGHHRPTAYLALLCLILGAVVPYVRAKAESLNIEANVGIAERAERLVAVLVGVALVGWGLSVWVLTVVLALLAVGSVATIVMRSMVVRRATARTESQQTHSATIL